MLCQSLHCIVVVVGGFLRSLGSSTELLLLHFSSFTIGRRLEVTVASEEEKLLKPFKPYCPLDASQNSAVEPSHVITVSAPRDAPRCEGGRCEEPSSSNFDAVRFVGKERKLPAVCFCDISRGFFLKLFAVSVGKVGKAEDLKVPILNCLEFSDERDVGENFAEVFHCIKCI